MPFLLKISWIFQNTPKIFIGMVLKGVIDKNPQTSEIRKFAILSQPKYLTFFDEEISQLFSYLYGSKVPKWNFAHILLWKKNKKIRKTPKNTLFTGPWLRTTEWHCISHHLLSLSYSETMMLLTRRLLLSTFLRENCTYFLFYIS